MKSHCYYFLLFFTIIFLSSAEENCSDVCTVVEKLQSTIENHAEKLSHVATYERRTDIVYQWFLQNEETLKNIMKSFKNESLEVPPKTWVYSERTTYSFGSEIAIECEVTGYPVPRVSWYKNNEILQTSERVQVLGNHTVIITRAEAVDSGRYRCKAANRVGNTSSPITINVEVRPEIRVSSERTIYSFGSDITIQCEVKGYPEPTVSWYKDNGILQTSERLQVLGDHTLIIARARATDSGTYHCEAVNRIGIASSPIAIYVQAVTHYPSCMDDPSFGDCRGIVNNGLCHLPLYHTRYCCKSCTLAAKPHLNFNCC